MIVQSEQCVNPEMTFLPCAVPMSIHAQTKHAS